MSNPYLSQIERGLKRPTPRSSSSSRKDWRSPPRASTSRQASSTPRSPRLPTRPTCAAPSRRPGPHAPAAEDPPRHLRVLRRGRPGPDAPPPTPRTRHRTTQEGDTMSVLQDIKKSVDTTPFFAAVGATDLAVEKVRDARVRAEAARVRADIAVDSSPRDHHRRPGQGAPGLALNQTLVVGGKVVESYESSPPAARSSSPACAPSRPPRTSSPRPRPPSPRPRVRSPPPARPPPTSSAPPSPPSPPVATRPPTSPPSSPAPSSRTPRPRPPRSRPP